MEPSQRYRSDHSDLLRKPLVGDDGVNPFADPAAPPLGEIEGVGEGADENVYGAPSQPDDRPVSRQPDYVATLSSRSKRILIFGVTGMIVSIACLAAYRYSLPIGLANLVLTIGAFLMGWIELKSMKAGVIIGGNRRHALAGMILGALGTPITLIAGALFINYWLWMLSGGG